MMKCDRSRTEIEAERLHHVAFEQLRKTTREDEESFVDRMRRWELEHAAAEPNGMAGGMGESFEEEQEAQADDEEDELEFQVDVGLDPLDPYDAQGDWRQKKSNVTELDFDDLARRMKGGACELEDYGLVREFQAKSTQ